jgi:hypothetical protein
MIGRELFLIDDVLTWPYHAEFEPGTDGARDRVVLEKSVWVWREGYRVETWFLYNGEEWSYD